MSRVKIPVELPYPTYLQDHRVEEGRAVLPAVEALELLAAAVRESFSGECDVLFSREAAFLRLLECSPGQSRPEELWAELGLAQRITPPSEPHPRSGSEGVSQSRGAAEEHTERAVHGNKPVPRDGRSGGPGPELQENGAGGVRAALCSRTRVGQAGLLRTLEHVRVVFGGGDRDGLPSPPEPLPEDGRFSFSAERLYAELVPFGPAFHNTRGEVLLSPAGAEARLRGPVEEESGERFPRPLGSPFPLDAAFHLACAWGQRRLGRVLFPVGYATRRVWCPCVAGEEFFCRVRVRETAARWADFDLWLLGEDGGVRETLTGVRMQDIFQGRRLAPAWIQAPETSGG